jgi:hypothetical protein
MGLKLPSTILSPDIEIGSWENPPDHKTFAFLNVSDILFPFSSPINQ